MQTKKALGIFSKTEKSLENTVSTRLAEKADQYKAEYDATQNEILNKRSQAQIITPFVEVIKRKIGNAIAAPDVTLPLVTTYDLYTGIRKMSDRSPKDNGLSRLATHLEKIWHADPLGTLNYGNVGSIVTEFKDRYPRSKAADAVEAECTRAGLHKLPVAKLARLASKVDSQESYDSLMETNGLDGSRTDQVRARALVRGLVAMKSGIEVDHSPNEVRDGRSTEERVADHMVSLEKNADYAYALELLQDAASLSETLQKAMSNAMMELHSDGMDEAGQQVRDLAVQMDSWVEQFNKTKDMAQVDRPIVPAIGDNTPAAPATQEETQLNYKAPVEKTPEEEAGLSKKWYDPRTWNFAPATALLKSAERVVKLDLDEPLRNRIVSFGERLSQMLPMMDDDHSEELDVPGEELALPEAPMDMPPMAEEPQMEQLDQGVDIVEQIDQAAQEIIQEAPPEAQSYIEHEMAEGHTAPPGTAEWGAEEILNEGHEFAPPSEGWLREEEEEMGLTPGGEAPEMPEAEMVADIDAPPGMPMVSAKGKVNKSMPMPGKIKTQPKVTSSAPDLGPESGAKALKASDIEDKLLAGVKVAYGTAAIFVNDNDEIELWNKSSGVACDFGDMDVAINDFMKLVAKFDETKVIVKVAGITYKIEEVVNVPCERCGEVYVFPRVASTDTYQCVCGFEIAGATVNDLIKLGYSGSAYQVHVTYPVGKDPQANKQVRARVISAVENVSGSAKIDDEGQGFVTATLWNVDEHTVQKTVSALRALGATAETKRVAQAAPAVPAVPAAPAPAQDDSLPTMALSELANAAFMNYKAQGLSFTEAMQAFIREHKERLSSAGPDSAGEILGAMAANYTSGAAAPAGPPPAQTPTPEAPPAAPGAPASPVAASKTVDAQSKMKVPSIRKPKDHVKVPADLGKDSASEDLLPSPGTIKTQPNKPKGKMSPKELGPDSSGKDLLPSPGAIKPTHDPKSNGGTKLPNKNLGKDTSGNDAFKEPALGSSPKVSK